MAHEISVGARQAARTRAESTSEDRAWFGVEGPADGHPIVLVHGVEYSRSIWTPQVEALKDEYRLLTPDLPGHGVLSHQPFRFETALERLVELIDTQAGGKACVLGMSLGGYIAMELADAHPEKLSGLVLSGCCSTPRGPRTIPHRVYAGLARHCNHRALNWLHRHLMKLVVPPRYARPIIEGGIYKDTVPDATYQLIGREVGTHLQGYQGPVLFLNGRYDFLFRRDEAEFVSACPNGELCVVPGAGHPTNLQNPNAFNEAVRSFAQSLDW